MRQIHLAQTAQAALCLSCPLAECRELTDECPLVIEQQKLWRVYNKRRTPEQNRRYNAKKDWRAIYAARRAKKVPNATAA